MHSTVLKRQLDRGTLSHATLLAGENRKETEEDAREVIRYVLGTTERSRFKLDKGVHPDLKIIRSEKNQIKIDEIRAVRSFFRNAPLEGENKVCVIADAQDLRTEAANALLKLLEEPPEYGVFLLTADSEKKLLPTIRSRCRIIRYYGKKDPGELTDKKKFGEIMDRVFGRDLLVLIDAPDFFEENDDNIYEFVEYFLYDMLTESLGGGEKLLGEYEEIYKKYNPSREFLGKMIEKTERTGRYRKNYVNSRLACEDLLLTLMEGSDD